MPEATSAVSTCLEEVVDDLLKLVLQGSVLSTPRGHGDSELFARSTKLNLGQIGAARREARVSHVKRCFDRPSNDITTTRYRNSELSITVPILVVLTVSLPQYQYWPAIDEATAVSWKL